MLNRITEHPFYQTRANCHFIGGFQDTRTNKEDFALTPYLFGVWATGKIIKVRGIGICWGYYSIYLGLVGIFQKITQVLRCCLKMAIRSTKEVFIFLGLVKVIENKFGSIVTLS